VDGGEETEALRVPTALYDWALGRSGMYFSTQEQLCWDRTHRYTIRYRDLESGRETELYRKEGAFEHQWLAVSPDEEWILYSEAPAATSELMLVESFR
jgi:hypothetical protein